MISAGKYNFAVTKGLTFGARVSYSDQSGEPIDFSDFKLVLQVRRARNAASELLLELNESNGGLTVNDDRSLGKFDVYITSAQTYALPAGAFQYDLTMFSNNAPLLLNDGLNPDVLVSPVLSGQFTVSDSTIGPDTNIPTRHGW